MAKHTQPQDDRWFPAEGRHGRMPVRRVGESGLQLPAISLGLWHNFGDDRPFQTQRNIIRRAFDLGVFHFDLANNYGPPPGSTEENFGRVLAKDLARFRHELVISTKAGWDMWPGPYGWGGSRHYLMTSLDESLARMGLDYVDIFYHHRPDPTTPLEETIAALADIRRVGKARYVGISSYSAKATVEAQAIAREMGVPLTIHQPSYSMINRWVEDDGLLSATAEQGMGVIAFSPLAQGVLTDKYLNGTPDGSRLALGKMDDSFVNDEVLSHVRALNDIAAERGQSLAQLAIAWILRDQGAGTVASALVGASSVEQLEANVAAVDNLEFTAEELARIDEHAVESGINQWWDATETRM